MAKLKDPCTKKCHVPLIVIVIAYISVGTCQDLNLTLVEQNSSYVKIAVNYAVGYTSNIKELCVNVENSATCSGLSTEYSFMSNDNTTGFIELTGLEPEGYYNFTALADHVSSPGSTASASLLLCIDPMDNGTDWKSESAFVQTNMELPSKAEDYEITLIPTICKDGNKVFEFFPGFSNIIYNLERGCEYEVWYAKKCSNSLTSNYVRYPDSFCTEPASPNNPSSLTIGDRNDTSVHLNGFSITSGMIEVELLTSCSAVNTKQNLSSTQNSATFNELTPGCLYSVRYKSVCYADAGVQVSGSQQSTLGNNLCTIPREINPSTVDLNIGSSTVTFGPTQDCTSCKVEPVEGYLHDYRLRSFNPVNGTDPGSKSSTSSLHITDVLPATKYEFELESVNECGDVSATQTQFVVCTYPSEIDNSTLIDFFNYFNVTFKGSLVPVAAVSGPLHRYKVLSINDVTPDIEFSAAANEDLLVDLVPGTNVIKLVTVVNTTDGCGVLQSNDAVERHYCVSPDVVDLSSISVTIQTDLIQIFSSEFKALKGTLHKLRVTSVTPTTSFVGGVNEAERFVGVIGINITDATSNYTIQVKNVNTCGGASQPVSFTVCFRPTTVENLKVSSSSRSSVNLTWEKPTDGTFDASHYNITCVPINGRDFVATTTVSTEDAFAYLNNGTLFFDSSGYFELLAGTPFECSVALLFFPGCDYSQLGDVSYESSVMSQNVKFNTSGVAVWITSTSNFFLDFSAGPCYPCTNYTYAEKGGTPVVISSNQSRITGLNAGTGYSVTVDGTTDYACTKPDRPNLLSTPIIASAHSITIQGTLSPVIVDNGTITHYQLYAYQPTSFPVLHGERERVLVNSDLIIGPDIVHLEPETKYGVYIQSVVIDSLYCPNGVAGSLTSFNLCTAPLPPLLRNEGSLSASTDSVTIYFSDFSVTERLVIETFNSSGPIGLYSPSNEITIGTSSLSIINLNAGHVYNMSVRAIFTDFGHCYSPNIAESRPSWITICTKPPKPTVTLASAEEYSIVLSIEEFDNSYQSISVVLDPSEQSSVVHSNGTITGLTPGREYTLNVTLFMDGDLCSAMTSESLQSHSTTVIACTYPLPPNVTTFVNNPTNFDQTINSITIKGSQTPLTNEHNLEQYSLDKTLPPGGYTTDSFFNVNEDMEIVNLSSGSVYSLLLNGFVGSNSCTLSSLSSAVINKICTAPWAPNATVASGTMDSITIRGSQSSITKSFSASLSETFDKYRIIAVNSNYSINSSITPVDQDATVYVSLEPLTRYNVTIQSIKDENCINGGPHGVEGEEATFTVCTAPAERVVTVHSNYGYFENKVVLESVTTNIGSFDTFSAYLYPPPTNASYINLTNVAFSSTDLELTNLDAATEYNLIVTVEKSLDDCGITDADSLFNVKSVNVCTAPNPPDLTNNNVIASNHSSSEIITVNDWPYKTIETIPPGKIDRYELMMVTNTSNGNPVSFTTSPSNSVSVSSYMYIYLPEMGTSYQLSFASVITTHCGGTPIHSERWTNVTACTAPSQPSIDESNRRTVAVANQTAITFYGGQIASSSDTYGFVFIVYYPSGYSGDDIFKNKPFAESSSSDLTIGNLTAGNGHGLSLVSVIGTTTNCGGTVVHSTAIYVQICTDPPDIEAMLVKRNATSFELNSIIPNSGWDYFSVDATPQLPQMIFNESGFNLPWSISGLMPGTQYIFNVSVMISDYCDYGTNHPSWNVIVTCTTPDPPEIMAQDQLSVTIVKETSITLIGSKINSSDTYAVVGLLKDGVRIPGFTRVQSTSADANLTLYNLSTGNSYTVELVSVIGTSTDCGGNTTDSELTTLTICTVSLPDIAVTMTRSTDSVVLESISPRYGWEYFMVEAAPALPRSYINQTNSTLPLEITDLSRGTQYTFTVSVTFSSCGTNQQATVTEIVCTAPGSLNFTHVDIYTVSSQIMIAAEMTPIASTNGPIGNYTLTSITPDPALIRVDPSNLLLNNQSMTIVALDPGTSYNLSFANVLSLCGSSMEGPVTPLYYVCTKPDSPSVAVTESTQTSITLYGSRITTASNSNFDLYSVISVFPDSYPTFNRTVTGSKNSLQNLTISGLTAGTQYEIQVVMEVGTGGTQCSIPSSRVDSVPETVRRCTTPMKSYIKPQDIDAVIKVNRTTVTLIGSLINSSDTYAVVGLLKDGIPVSGFIRVQSMSAGDNLILDNLSPGSTYTVELVSVIGQSTDCGGYSLDSEKTTLTVCTALSDLSMHFTTEGHNEIWLRNITPSEGWDYFNVTAVPPLPNEHTNQSTFPVQITGLDYGSEYNVTVTVSNGPSCSNQAQSITSTTQTVCTEPAGPLFDGLYHSATNNTITINANSEVVRPPANELDSFALSGTTPRGGVSNDGYVSVKGGSITITGLSPGIAYRASFHGMLNRTSCGGVVTGGELGIGQELLGLCTVPSNPVLSWDALSSTEDNITVSFDKVTAPIGEHRDKIEIANVSGNPDPQYISQGASDSAITIGGLSAGNSYTLFIISTLGDGNTNCNTNQDGRNDNILRSTPTIVNACTRPPVPIITSTGVNSTAIEITINNPFGFDAWSATINGDNGSVHSRNYTSSVDQHLFSSGVSPSGGNYLVVVTFYVGMEDGTDCGIMGIVTNNAIKLNAVVGCDKPPSPVINATFLYNNTLVVSVDNHYTSFDIWSVTIQNPIAGTKTSIYLNSTDSHVFHNTVKGSRYNINATLVNVGGGQNCGLHQSEQTSGEISYCTPPDRINSTLFQSGSENQLIYFSGISGVVSGVYDSMHYSLSSTIAQCYEQYQNTISNIAQRQNTTILTSGCTYDLEIWAQCGEVKGPSFEFAVYVPGEVNVTILESWKNATALQYIVQDIPAQVALQSVSCEEVQSGSNCTDDVITSASISDSALITAYNLNPGNLYQVVFEFSVGVVGVHYETVYACLDPLDNLNWLEQSSTSSTYDITAIPTKCPVANQSLVHAPGSPPNIHLLESGCEYRIVYSVRCELPDGRTIIDSNKIQHRDTACTDPETPLTSLSLVSSSERELELTGFGVTGGYYDSMEVVVYTDCMQNEWNKVFYTSNQNLRITGLVPGCKYWLNYRAMCYASTDEDNGNSTFVMETVSDSLCTVPRKIDLQTVMVDIATNPPSNEPYYKFGPLSPNSVESVEGYISHFKLQPAPLNSLVKSTSSTPANVSFESVSAEVFPASEVRLSLQGVIEDCGGVISNEVATFTLCSQPEKVSSLQVTSVDTISLTLSWNPPENGTIDPFFYELSITQQGEDAPTLIRNISSSDQKPSGSYDFYTKDVDDILLPSGTQFTCSVRTIIPYSCNYEEVFGGVKIDDSFSISSIPCATDGTGGQPTSHSYAFLNPTVAQINWTAPDDFFNVLDDDYYSVLVNGIEQRKIKANRRELSTTVEGLDLCSDYNVTLAPYRPGLIAETVQFTIRSWSNDTTRAEILGNFAELAMTECGVCPNAALNNVCQFPFDHNGVSVINTCVPFTRGGDLTCRDSNGVQMTCYSNIIESCKPQSPSLGDPTFSTLVGGESVQLMWNVSSDYFENFLIYINEELVATVEETEFNATNLTAGVEYSVVIVMNSFGRQSEQVITFTMTNSSQNVFASDITSNSTKLIMDSFETPTNDSIGQNCSIDQLQISQAIKELDYVTLFLSDQEIQDKKSVETVEIANSFTVQDLSSGLFYCFNITPIDACTNDVISGLALSSCAPTVPQQITEGGNNLALSVDSRDGIQIHLDLTANTAAEIIHVEVTCVAPVAEIIESDGALLIKSMKEEIQSHNETECRTVDCVQGGPASTSSKPMDREVVSADERKAGLHCIVEIYTSTGISESEHTRVERYETPYPIENLFVYFVDETSIRVSWRPPETGFFDHFIINVTSEDDRGLYQSQKIDGYLRYEATRLHPGLRYHLSVYAVADPEGTVQSNVTVVQTDTAPVPPKNFAIEEPVNVQRAVGLKLEPPSSGDFGGYQIEIEKLEDREAERRQRRDSNGGILEGDVELPLRLGKNETDVELVFAEHGSVYSVTVRTLSENGKPSIGFVRQEIMTGIQNIGVIIHEVIKDSNKFCFVWEITNGTNEVMFNRLRTELTQDVSAFRQSESSVIETESGQQGVGLKCLDFVHNYTENNMTVELTLSKFHERSSLSKSASPVVIKVNPFPEIELRLHIIFDCQDTSCDMTIADNKLPHRDKVIFNVELSEFNGSDSSYVVRNEMFDGSDCHIMAANCTFSLTDLNVSSDYSVLIEVLLFKQIFPMTFTERFVTLETFIPPIDPIEPPDEDDMPLLIIIIGAAGGFLFLVLCVVLMAACCCCSTERPPEGATYQDPAYARYEDLTDNVSPIYVENGSRADGTYINPEVEANYAEVMEEMEETFFEPNANMRRVTPYRPSDQNESSNPADYIRSIYDENLPNGRNMLENIELQNIDYLEPSGERVEEVYPTTSGSGDYFDTIEDELDIRTPGRMTPVDDVLNTTNSVKESIPMDEIVKNMFLGKCEYLEPDVQQNEYIEETNLETERSGHQDEAEDFD